MLKKQLFLYVAVFGFLFITTTAVVLYARGYRFTLFNGRPEFSGTGLLVTTSTPDGAQVFVNGHLTTATNNTINLLPGDYEIKISKEGYFPWQKKIKIQKEVVSKTEALLLPVAPELQSLTSTGVSNPVIDPSRSRIAYVSGGQTARKNGIYVLDMTSRPILTLQSSSFQIADDTVALFSKASLTWSPDGQEIVATISGTLETPTTYLLKANSFNQSPQDVTATLDSVAQSWERNKEEIRIARLNVLKTNVADLVKQYFKIIAWSADETKILYVASKSATLPIITTPRLIGADSAPEDRTIKEDSTYVYDIKEDRNFKLETSGVRTTEEGKPFSWLPDSSHLLYVHNSKIDIVEYDGLNQTTVYAGPFLDSYVFPWTNETKILTLTNLGNPLTPPNLYVIGLK